MEEALINSTSKSIAFVLSLCLFVGLLIISPAVAQTSVETTAVTVDFGAPIWDEQEPGCGAATFTTYDANHRPVQGQPAYTVT